MALAGPMALAELRASAESAVPPEPAAVGCSPSARFLRMQAGELVQRVALVRSLVPEERVEVPRAAPL